MAESSGRVVFEHSPAIPKAVRTRYGYMCLETILQETAYKCNQYNFRHIM